MNNYLEFTVKTYPLREGVTNQLLELRVNDELILGDVFGTISFKEEGVFIAGGAGITFFISVFRYLNSKIASAITSSFLPIEQKLTLYLSRNSKNYWGSNFINILSEERTK